LIEVYVEPLPEYLSHPTYAELVEPGQPGESEYAYFTRLELKGYQMYSYRHGHLLLANFEGKLQPRVKPS
jgi:hypothetical protein